MTTTTKIEWARNADGTRGKTWNPTRGCSRVSPGCGGGITGPSGERGGCYAEGIAARFSGPGQPFDGFATMTEHGPRWTGKLALLPDVLGEPLRVRKPTTWFTNSMSDLFHEKLTDEQIAAVFGVMAACPRHTFQVLTKRADRMRAWFEWVVSQDGPCGRIHPAALCGEAACNVEPTGRWMFEFHPPAPAPWPLPNVWLGVSAETQRYFDERWPLLRDMPAAVRFVSYEPALGPLDIGNAKPDQIIAGAESGHGHRPFVEDWARAVRDQCQRNGVAFFYKQRLDERGHKVSLPMLDGRRWDEMPCRTAT